MNKIARKEKSHGLDLTQGAIPKVVLKFAWPFLISGIISALYGAIDMFVISYFSVEEVISGVSTGSQVLMLAYTLIMGLATGGTVLIGRKIGEKDDEGGARAAGTFMMIGLVAALALTAIMVIFTNPMLTVLRTPELARPAAHTYVMFALIGLPFNVAYNFISAIARGLGNSTTPSAIGILAAVVNIVLDLLFVAGFGMAADGVALATSIAQIMSFVIIGIWLLKKKFPFAFGKRHFRFDRASLRSIFSVGIPLSLQEILVNISFMIITAIINDMGVVASAAVGLVNKIFNLGAIIPVAIGNAIAAIAAQNIGAGRRDRAIKSLFWGIGYSLIVEVIFVALCLITPETITGFLADGKQELIEAGAAHLRSFSLDLIMIAFIFCMNSYLSSCGKSTMVMIHSLIATFAIRVPLSILFARMAGEVTYKLFMLGFASPLSTLGSIIICVPYIIHLERKAKASAAGPTLE